MQTLGGFFFVLSPILLARATGHYALAGQWTLLAALWLCLRRKAGLRQDGSP